MTTAIFDTLKASRELKAAGIDEAHAEAIVTTVAGAFEDTVATKSDVVAIRADMDKLEASIKGDIKLLKWMIGVVLACVAFPILKSFFV